MTGEDAPDGNDGALVSLDLRLSSEELAVLCRDRERDLELILPELAGVNVLDVVERTLVARGFLELDPDGGTRLAGFANYLVDALCDPVGVEHVLVDELGGGPGWWEAVAHGEEIAVTITPSEVGGVYDLHITGTYPPPATTNGSATTVRTTLGRLEDLLTARRENVLEPDPEDWASVLVYGAASYAQRVRRTIEGRTLAVEHRTVLDAADLGTWELLGVPSPADGDDADIDATITWVMLPDSDEEEDER